MVSILNIFNMADELDGQGGSKLLSLKKRMQIYRGLKKKKVANEGTPYLTLLWYDWSLISASVWISRQ